MLVSEVAVETAPDEAYSPTPVFPKLSRLDPPSETEVLLYTVFL